MTELEHAIKHIKTRADAWAVKEVTEALQSISERMDKAVKKLERYEKHICFDCKYFTEDEEQEDEEHCSKCVLIGTEWEQKK